MQHDYLFLTVMGGILFVVLIIVAFFVWLASLLITRANHWQAPGKNGFFAGFFTLWLVTMVIHCLLPARDRLLLIDAIVIFSVAFALGIAFWRLPHRD